MSDNHEVTIQLRVPAADADAMEEAVNELLAKAKTQVRRIAEEAELRTIERKKFKYRTKSFFALAPEAFRLYQKYRQAHASAKATYLFIANQLHLDAPIAAEALVQIHRRKHIKERQKMALKLARQGLSNTAISRQLGVSTRTVSRLLVPLLPSKLGGKNA